MATVAVEVPDEKTAASLRERDVQIRDAVMSVLERATLASLTVPGARDTLRGRIAVAIAPHLQGAAPARVYLPQFVIQ
jgi:flagellar basal body-associated protein FliL